MADRHPTFLPFRDDSGDAALQRVPWRKQPHLSSLAEGGETFLAASGFDRGPWLAAAMAGGIAAWFALDRQEEWLLALAACAILALGALALWRGRPDRVHLQQAALAIALCLALGIILIWARSSMVGAPAIDRPMVGSFDARILDRIEQPAEGRVRLVLALRMPETGEAVRVRVNLAEEMDDPAFDEGAVLRLRARLMPPASPMFPGGYDFARTAWFQGLVATGSVLDTPEILEPAASVGTVARMQRRLSAHVRSQLSGSPGTIAAALASGDRGAISEPDEEAMRDAGLTHLLSISGLHVSAVIAGAYFLAIKLLALWPWLALRVRLPVVAAAIGGLAGIGFTLLTGAEVPTVRSCVAAMLVLGALMLGREPLSLRMVAVAAVVVLLLWPESLVSPGFQMSFAAVIAIIALHQSAPVRAFLAPSEEGWLMRAARRTSMLLLTGVVIELALMPIVLFHFHKAGVYGAGANVFAIPLTTFATMPLIALALALDAVGAGGPAWWLAGKSIELILGLAHWTASQPGAVRHVPTMTAAIFALFVAGELWLALWRGRARLWGLMPVAFATVWLWLTPPPDLLISSDGQHVGIVGEHEQVISLRDTRSDFVSDNLRELSGLAGELLPLDRWEGADCSRDFCTVILRRGGRNWRLLIARSRVRIPERQLAAACERADIVIADRWLPRSCRPLWLKADGRMLTETGGLAITLASGNVRSVADSQGEHGWWRGGGR